VKSFKNDRNLVGSKKAAQRRRFERIRSKMFKNINILIPLSFEVCILEKL